MDDTSALDAETELIEASLLPAELLQKSVESVWPVIIDISSSDSKLAIHISLGQDYPQRHDVYIEIKGAAMGRDEAEGWKTWVDEKLEDWDEAGE
jgi:hypothetical protein